MSLVMFGMWLIFAPTLIIAIISAGGLLLAFPEGMEGHTAAKLVGMIMSGFWIVLAATILWKTTRNYLRARTEHAQVEMATSSLISDADLSLTLRRLVGWLAVVSLLRRWSLIPIARILQGGAPASRKAWFFAGVD